MGVKKEHKWGLKKNTMVVKLPSLPPECKFEMNKTGLIFFIADSACN